MTTQSRSDLEQAMCAVLYTALHGGTYGLDESQQLEAIRNAARELLEVAPPSVRGRIERLAGEVR